VVAWAAAEAVSATAAKRSAQTRRRIARKIGEGEFMAERRV
jgi:hypothetical protein